MAVPGARWEPYACRDSRGWHRNALPQGRLRLRRVARKRHCSATAAGHATEECALGHTNDTPLWVLSLFDDLNSAHFNGQLQRPVIITQAGAMQRKNAWYVHTPHIKTPRGPLIAIGITQEVLNKGREYTADTLLHEMIHHAVATLHNENPASHGGRFCAIANEIGASLGLRTVRPDTMAAECWPQSVRQG
ncbi:SprT-like domain-containing protein [Sorangium sp. So ce315]|uniref:SprT-like domain-containing protein n=1 Tax=Sorangium sp. So ce315 TaxID=3133299 RepID=UPI003F63FE90